MKLFGYHWTTRRWVFALSTIVFMLALFIAGLKGGTMSDVAVTVVAVVLLGIAAIWWAIGVWLDRTDDLRDWHRKRRR